MINLRKFKFTYLSRDKKNTHTHTHAFLCFFLFVSHTHIIVIEISLIITQDLCLGLGLERSGRISALVVSLDPVVAASLPFRRWGRSGHVVGFSERCVDCPARRSCFGFLDAFVRLFHVGVGGGGNRQFDASQRRVALLMTALSV